MAGAGERAAHEVLLKAPVELDREVVERVRQALSEALAAPVTVKTRVDRRTKGVAVYLDEGRRVSIEPGAEPVVSVGETNLRRALAGFTGTRLTLVSKVRLDPSIPVTLARKVSAAAGRELVVDVDVDPHQDVGAALMIGDDKRIVLDSRAHWLDQLVRAVAEKQKSGEIGAEEAGATIRAMLQNTEPELKLEEMEDTGSVLEVGDGVALVSGLKKTGSQELVKFENGVYGLAFSLLFEAVGCILLGPEEGIREGSDVERTGHLLKVPVGEQMIGRIVNALGEPIDDKGPTLTELFHPLEKKAPGIIKRHPVMEPLHTGIKVLDALVPLGRGQRELIIGDRKIGKTTMAVDTILSQKGRDVLCVYASIGQKATSLARVVKTLEEHGAMEYTTIVASMPNEQPAFRYVTPYTACAIGEHLMEQGKDALVVFDDLSKHAVTYREMSALLKRPIGREAYPGDIFYIHSRLLERAARLSDQLGGGSLTALPIVETQAGDISAFIPTNVISICDGQIFLDTGLFNEGIRPAMEVGLSVSRVGGAAQRPAMKKVAGRLRIDLAQYQEMAQFVKFGAEVDQATLNQLDRGERCRDLLKQTQHLPLLMAEEVLILYAGVSGLLDEIEVSDVAAFEQGFFAYLAQSQAPLLAQIEATGELDSASEDKAIAAIEAFKTVFASRRAATAEAAVEVAGLLTSEAEPEAGAPAEPREAVV